MFAAASASTSAKHFNSSRLHCQREHIPSRNEAHSIMAYKRVKRQWYGLGTILRQPFPPHVCNDPWHFARAWLALPAPLSVSLPIHSNSVISEGLALCSPFSSTCISYHRDLS
jgi:hypothetical protein